MRPLPVTTQKPRGPLTSAIDTLFLLSPLVVVPVCALYVYVESGRDEPYSTFQPWQAWQKIGITSAICAIGPDGA